MQPPERKTRIDGLNLTKMNKQDSYKFVKYLWQDAEADKLQGEDRLVYRSNRLGDDLTLTNTGGGNTSSKLMEEDPLTDEQVVLVADVADDVFVHFIAGHAEGAGGHLAFLHL